MPRECASSVDLYTLRADYAASGGAVHPNLELVSQINFPIAYTLVGVHLSTSYTNLADAYPGGVFLIVGLDVPDLRVTSSIKAVAAHIMFGSGFQTCDDWISFDDYGIEVPPRTPISFYGFGSPTPSALVRLFSIACLHMLRR